MLGSLGVCSPHLLSPRPRVDYRLTEWGVNAPRRSGVCEYLFLLRATARYLVRQRTSSRWVNPDVPTTSTPASLSKASRASCRPSLVSSVTSLRRPFVAGLGPSRLAL